MATAAPKKYLDSDQVVANPEWIKWRDELRGELLEDARWNLSALGYSVDTYLPEDSGKAIPEDGAWILVLEEPLTELRDRFRLPLLSMWRARPHTLNDGAVVLGSGKRSIKLYPKQAVISTPGGDLHLWPHEYIIASNPMALLSHEDSMIHSLGGTPVLAEDQLFYLMSRGISRHDATMLLFDQITTTDFVYVTFPEEVTEALRGVGMSLHRHMALNPRGGQ